MNSATLLRVDIGTDRERIVVTEADEVIHISAELMEEVTRPNRERVSGDMILSSDLVDEFVSFGTEGDGLGRLTYRIVDHDVQRDLYVARREP